MGRSVENEARQIYDVTITSKRRNNVKEPFDLISRCSIQNLWIPRQILHKKRLC